MITRNIPDVKLHSFVYGYTKKPAPPASFLQNSSESLNMLFGSSGGLGLLGGGLNLSGIGLNTSLGGLNNSMSGGINGNLGNNSGSNNSGRFGMGNSMNNIQLMNNNLGMSIPGLSHMNAGIQPPVGLPIGSMMPPQNSGGVNMNNINNLGGGIMGNSGNNANASNSGNNNFQQQLQQPQSQPQQQAQQQPQPQQAGSNPSYFPSGKFSSMMGEWTDEEQLAFENALKQYIYLFNYIHLYYIVFICL